MSSIIGAFSGVFGKVLNKTVDSPQASICILFFLYKSLLDIIAFSAPGPGFDDSVSLSGWPEGGPVAKLIRWDAVWFTSLAQRGYKYEQDYAFGYGYTNLLSISQYFWPDASYDESIHREAIFGILVSHVSHLLGALLLYRVSLMVFRNHQHGERISFIASCLHVLSPAGIFICAPYTEAPFSFLKFAAYFAYSSAQLDHLDGKFLMRDTQTILSGALIGTACTFRSNGLLSGIIFLIDAIEDGLTFLRMRGDFARFRKICVTVVAGLLIAAGQAYPQILAYIEFCTDRNPFEKRPFCHHIPPGIYTFVQQKYWDVGPFKYWRPIQIPLFILAGPMLFMMFYSSYWVYKIWRNPPTTSPPTEESQPLTQSPNVVERTSGDFGSPTSVPSIDTRLLMRFTIPQFCIAFTCFFLVHVQIITRLSSAYPVWYWWLAAQIIEYSTDTEKYLKQGWKGRLPMFFCRWAVVYGVVQTGLFAEFLPPA